MAVDPPLHPVIGAAAESDLGLLVAFDLRQGERLVSFGQVVAVEQGVEVEGVVVHLHVAAGQLLIGEKGTIMDTTDYCNSPRLIPESAMKAFKRPEKTIPRVPRGNHYQEWINAIKGGPKPGSNFDYAGPFSEVVLMGNLALRVGKKVEWDGDNMRCTNIPEANQYVTKTYRKF